MTIDSNVLAVSAGLNKVLGPHRIVAEIGRGGMANVFLAVTSQGRGARRHVVLKQLRSEFVQQDDFRVMFENEASLATRFRHAHVVQTHDFCADPALCVLVMEFLDGQTLSRIRQKARRGSQVPFAIHLRVLSDVLAGLHYVHELKDARRPLGIVHRDVSPSNVFVTYDGRVKVVDFGIAQATLRDHASPSNGLAKGKLAYMSPEAVRNERVDRRTDIFSVGIMLWEAATGLRFWRDQDEMAVFRRLAAGDLPMQATGLRGAGAEMFEIAARALAVDPLHRYPTAVAMRKELEEVLARLKKTTPIAGLATYMKTSFSTEKEQSRALVEALPPPVPPPAVSQNATQRHPSRRGVVRASYPGVDSFPGGVSAPFPGIGSSYRGMAPNDASRSQAVSASYPGIDATEALLGSSSASLFDEGPTSIRSHPTAEDVREMSRFRPGLRRVLGVASMAAAAALGIAYAAHSPSGVRAHAAGAPSGDLTALTAAVTSSAGGATEASSAPRVRSVAMGEKSDLPSPAEARRASSLAVTAEAPSTASEVGSPRGTISAVFVVHPFQARLFLDGVALAGNPAGIRRSSDDKPHLFRAEAPGYAPAVRVVDLDRDVALELDLAAEGGGMGRMAPAPSEAHDAAGKPRIVKRRDDPWGI
jgi:serine/threonine protein kinase